jgi:hypothetical protein
MPYLLSKNAMSLSRSTPPSAETSLFNLFLRVPDFRRPQGRRYPLPKLLTLLLLALLSGHYAYRDMARFCQANREALLAALRLRTLPSHVTFRTLLTRLDFEALNHMLRTWARARFPVQAEHWVCLDAKAIRASVTHYKHPYQDFVSLVSAFAQAQGVVLGTAAYQNKHAAEALLTQGLITELVTTLGLSQVTFTLDAPIS